MEEPQVKPGDFEGRYRIVEIAAQPQSPENAIVVAVTVQVLGYIDGAGAAGKASEEAARFAWNRIAPELGFEMFMTFTSVRTTFSVAA